MKNVVLILIMGSFAFACSKCGDAGGKNLLNAKQEISKTEEVQCRCVCDKKLSKLQKMSEALEFYKNSKIYKFSN